METSSSMMLNSLARFSRSSLIRADTISRFVMSSDADQCQHTLSEEEERGKTDRQIGRQ